VVSLENGLMASWRKGGGIAKRARCPAPDREQAKKCWRKTHNHHHSNLTSDPCLWRENRSPGNEMVPRRSTKGVYSPGTAAGTQGFRRGRSWGRAPSQLRRRAETGRLEACPATNIPAREKARRFFKKRRALQALTKR